MSATSSTPGAQPLTLPRRYPREYAIWRAMHQRCRNPRCKGYRYYGGRGIRVAARWSGPGGDARFFADLDPQPFKRASVDRRDNDRDYTRGNVGWADPATQARNMRSNRALTYRGRTMILVEWAEELGVKPGTLGARLAKGWSVAKALTKAVAPRRPFSPWARRRCPGAAGLVTGRLSSGAAPAGAGAGPRV